MCRAARPREARPTSRRSPKPAASVSCVIATVLSRQRRAAGAGPGSQAPDDGVGMSCRCRPRAGSTRPRSAGACRHAHRRRWWRHADPAPEAAAGMAAAGRTAWSATTSTGRKRPRRRDAGVYAVAREELDWSMPHMSPYRRRRRRRRDGGIEGRRSSSVRATSAPPTFSSRYVTRLVPGIGDDVVALRQTQARASWPGVQPFLGAASTPGRRARGWPSKFSPGEAREVRRVSASRPASSEPSVIAPVRKPRPSGL